MEEASDAKVIYDEVLQLKDLFLRRLMDDKVKSAAILQLKDNNEALQRQLDDKAIMTLVRDIILICDRINAQEIVDDMTASIEEELTEILARREFHRMPRAEFFDPTCHNAVGTEEETPKHPERSIVKVVKDGYYYRDRVFRPADVIVSIKKSANAEG